MINKKNLKKQIIYRSSHRGTKEMDLLLGSFVKKNIDKLRAALMWEVATNSTNKKKQLKDDNRST